MTRISFQLRMKGHSLIRQDNSIPVVAAAAKPLKNALGKLFQTNPNPLKDLYLHHLPDQILIVV